MLKEFEVRRALLPVLLLLLSQVLVHSVDWQAQTGPFDALDSAGSAVSPPPLPSEQAKAPVVLSLELHDFSTKAPIDDTHAIVLIVDNASGNESQRMFYVATGGNLNLDLTPGRYDFFIQIDQIDTPGKDYYYSFSQRVSTNQTESISLFPVGSLVGTVESAQGLHVVGAKVRTDCGSEYGELEPQTTDEFGSFSVPLAPVGSCRISAAFGTQTGFADINVTRGGRVVSLVQLNESLTNAAPSANPIQNDVAGLVAGGIVVIALLGASIWFEHRMKNRTIPSPPAPEAGTPPYNNSKMTYGKKKTGPARARKERRIGPREPRPSSSPVSSPAVQLPALPSRAQDILKTLNENEQKAARFLLENNHQSTQARIRNSIGMPKTSLARVLHMLEKKRVVEIERIGKLKKVRLTSWFLGKE